MIEFRKLMQAKLASLHPRVYYQVAPEAATFPYLIYDMPTNNNLGEWGSVITVDVDGWDIPADGDTTALEALIDTVRVGLNKATLVNNSIGAVVYFDDRMSVQDEDKRIKRIKLTFVAKLFERSI